MSDAEEKTESRSSQPDAEPEESRESSGKPDKAEKKPEENAGGESETASGEETSSEAPETELETMLGVYPLREPGEDPRWALRTVWIWIGFVLVCLVFILTMLILGAIYD